MATTATLSHRIQLVQSAAERCRLRVKELDSTVRRHVEEWKADFNVATEAGLEEAENAAKRAENAMARRVSQETEIAEMRKQKKEIELELARLQEEKKEMVALVTRKEALRARREQVEKRRLEVSMFRETPDTVAAGGDSTEREDRVKSHAELVADMMRTGALFKRLGLALQTIQPRDDNEEGHRLLIEFRFIDQKNPQKPFSFMVRITQDQRYHVERVNPPVISNMSLLVRRLNETNDFGGFARSVRREFQAYVNQSS